MRVRRYYRVRTIGVANVKTMLVVNPHAGRQNILRELRKVQRVLAESGREVTVVRTETAEQAARVIRRSFAEQPETLICCGGDGTLSRTVSEVLKAGETLPLGYIPAGSTNDFASSLGLSRVPEKAAKQIVEGAPRLLDAGRIGRRHFVYVASFGAFTRTSYCTDQKRKNTLGHWAYVLEGMKELPEIKSYPVRAETAEGDIYEGNYIFGSLSNSTSFGGLVRLNPEEVDLSDGKLELMLVKAPRNPGEWGRILFSLLNRNFDRELITFVHTSGVKFYCQRPMPWSLDGEFAPGSGLMEAEALPRAIQLYC